MYIALHTTPAPLSSECSYANVSMMHECSRFWPSNIATIAGQKKANKLKLANVKPMTHLTHTNFDIYQDTS